MLISDLYCQHKIPWCCVCCKEISMSYHYVTHISMTNRGASSYKVCVVLYIRDDSCLK